MLNHVHGGRYRIGGDDDDGDKLEELGLTPYALEVASTEEEAGGREDELSQLNQHLRRTSPMEPARRTSMTLTSTNAADSNVHGYQMTEPGTTTIHG